MAAGSQRVAVVGGGITGLAAAHALCTGTGNDNDNGSEFISKVMDKWADEGGVPPTME